MSRCGCEKPDVQMNGVVIPGKTITLGTGSIRSHAMMARHHHKTMWKTLGAASNSHWASVDQQQILIHSSTDRYIVHDASHVAVV
mmetsp:Transcript_126860/g.237113  ORF Transcript_126860/g.237113 Transcript_126860/m.237113 type:complete len:85 (+) Transcript_126860:450-704(+)